MPCGWKGNRRSGIALAIGSSLTKGLGEGDEQLASQSDGV